VGLVRIVFLVVCLRNVLGVRGVFAFPSLNSAPLHYEDGYPRVHTSIYIRIYIYIYIYIGRESIYIDREKERERER
jgi:hypothetical protein